MSARILVVDDEADLRRVLSFNLNAEGFTVEALATGQEGLDSIARERPGCVVLDVMLPDISGTDVCKAIREMPRASDTPVLMLTARGNEADRLLGFEVGADDYVLKPFSVREVVMRVRALLRRSQERDHARAVEPKGDGKKFSWRGLDVDLVRHRVRANEEDLALRPLEFKLLSLFAEHPGRVFTRSELLTEVWGMDPATNTRTVDVHIRRLRTSLREYGAAIETIHGVGYRLRDPQ